MLAFMAVEEYEDDDEGIQVAVTVVGMVVVVVVKAVAQGVVL